MLPMTSIKLPAMIEHLERFLGFVSEHAKEQGFTSDMLKKIELASEEALVNVINYAYPDKHAGEVEVSCGLDDNNRFVIEIMDSGTPFNPLSLSEPNLTEDVSERPIGGLGIHLIKKMMDEVDYRREGNNNILTLIISK
jgi:sigma-B regulation protein RsbU (phosphoserine phosphatase)